MANPKRKHRTSGHRKYRRRNRSHALLANPRRNYRRRSYRRPNATRRHHYRRRNPSRLGGTKQLLEDSVFVLAGIVGSRALPQVLLKDKNTGFMGYAANVAAAIGLGFLAGKFINREAGHVVLLGGIAGVGSRIFEDTVGSSVLPSGSLLGAYGDSRYDLGGLGGEYVDSYFSVPTISDRKLITAPPAVAMPVAATPAHNNVPSVEHVQAITNMAGMGKYGGKYSN